MKPRAFEGAAELLRHVEPRLLTSETKEAFYQRVEYRPIAEFVEIRFCEE